MRAKSEALRVRPDGFRYVFIVQSPDPRSNRMRLDTCTTWDHTNKKVESGIVTDFIACDIVDSTIHRIDMGKLTQFMQEWRDNHTNKDWRIDTFYFAKGEGDNGKRERK